MIYDTVVPDQVIYNKASEMSKKILSYSLYRGDHRWKCYLQGILANKEVLQELYPDWIVRIYIGSDYPQEVYRIFEEWGYELIKMPKESDKTGALWRFLPIWDGTVDIVLVKEADSIPTYTDRAAEQVWLQSGLCFTTCKWWHEGRQWISIPRCGATRLGKSMISKAIPLDKINYIIHNAVIGPGADEKWLTDFIMPIVKDSLFTWEVTWNSDDEGFRDDEHIKGMVYHVRATKPPMDSVVIRHHLTRLSRNTNFSYDDIAPYYGDDEITQIVSWNEQDKKRDEQGLKHICAHKHNEPLFANK